MDKDSNDTVLGGKSAGFETPQDIIGKTFGDYKILNEIGRGGMAVVYTAHQISLDRKVAIKVIPQSLTEDPGYLERFKREASSAASLNHPNIVSIHGFGQFDNTYYYVMDIAKGKTLDQAISDKKHEILKRAKNFSIDDALKIVEQAASALSYAHKQGVIHRDIKPSNLMIDEEAGRVLITDFGLAKSTKWEKITPRASLFGTPAYMSPEQASGKELDQRTDIYSLGAVLYEMMTGALPYSGNNALEIIDKVKNAPLVPPRNLNAYVPTGIESIILKAMSRNIRLRYQNMDEFSKDIQDFREGKKITTYMQIAKHKANEEKPQNNYLIRLIFSVFLVFVITVSSYFIWNFLNAQKKSRDINSKLQLARNYEQLGMKGEAIKTYIEIADRYPNTDFAEIAKKRLLQLEGEK